MLPPDTPRDVKRDVADTPGGIPHPHPDALTSELRDRLRYVEEQLVAERQAHAEARRLLMAALERIPPQIEAPQEASEAAETGEKEPERAGPRSGAGEAQEGPRRPWWRRVFGN